MLQTLLLFQNILSKIGLVKRMMNESDVNYINIKINVNRGINELMNRGKRKSLYSDSCIPTLDIQCQHCC